MNQPSGSPKFNQPLWMRQSRICKYRVLVYDHWGKKEKKRVGMPPERWWDNPEFK